MGIVLRNNSDSTVLVYGYGPLFSDEEVNIKDGMFICGHKMQTPIPEKNAKLNKAKAQYQKLNDWRNKRKR